MERIHQMAVEYFHELLAIAFAVCIAGILVGATMLVVILFYPKSKEENSEK